MTEVPNVYLCDLGVAEYEPYTHTPPLVLCFFSGLSGGDCATGFCAEDDRRCAL